MPIAPPQPPDPVIYDDTAYLFKDGIVGPFGIITAANSIGLTSNQAHTIDTGFIGIPFMGPTTFTVDLLGLKIPFTLEVDIDDGGVARTDSYDMGPSVTSQSITLSATETITDMRAKRRF